jgi:hypothetical protein
MISNDDDKKLVEQIVYTASLATKPSEIDNILDSLRTITAKDASPTPEEKQTLLNIQIQLEDYLVNKERFRQFTQESLKLQIQQHVSGDTSQRSKKLATIIVVASFVVAFFVFLIPGLADIQQRVQASATTAFSLITIGSGIMFFNALPAFQSKLKPAFIFICGGCTLLGLSLLEQPFLEIFSLRQYPIVSIIYPLPILLGAILFYVGIKKYGQIIGVNNFWTTHWPVLMLGLIFALTSIFAPHLPSNEPELIHKLAAIIWAVMLPLPVAAAVILKYTQALLPELYKIPIKALFLSMFPIIIVISYQLILRIVAGPFMQGLVAYVLFSLVIIMGLLLLRAGYIFNKVSRY